MGIAQRIHDTIEDWQAEWKDRLRGWLFRTIGEGLTKFAEDAEPGAIDAYRDYITRLKDDPNIPLELRSFYEKALTPGNPFAVGGALITMVLGSLGALLGGSVPVGNIMRYEQDKILRTYRLDPIQAITAWRRDPVKYANVFQDLNEQGWDESRIEALKFFTLFLPNADEQTLWLAREVFEPELVAKYGLDAELPKYTDTDFAKIGVTPEQMRNKWRAHWEHASWMQMVEMLHRGLVTEADVYEWFKMVEIVPHWRDLLIQTAYTWPTRVDVRRWWDMRTIDETELRRLYSGMGYRGVNLDNYVLWTKVYVAFPDLLARWSKGWITLAEVRAELTALGMPAERVEEMIQTKIKVDQPERTAKERDVTKTDIIKGVKQGVISRTEGIELLIDMGYDEDEADYILSINIPPDEEDVVIRQRELSKTDIIKGLKAEIITEAEARARLIELRYSPTDSLFLIDIFKATITPPAEPREREASKADIVLAVKKGLITPETAYLMLQDIGFTPEASAFILEVRAESSPFSPLSYSEFKDLTHKYRVATGREEKPMPEEIKKAADEVVRVTGEVEALARSIAEEKRGLIEAEVLPEETTARLTELEVARNRAISELARLKSEYDRLVAEWKHAPG